MPTLQVNTYGVRRVCQAFIPLLEAGGGRVVNVTSAAGPMFVASCSPERQRVLSDPAVCWQTLEALMAECVSIEGDGAAFDARGLGTGAAYGFSKACANAYTIELARDYPNLVINVCTPGFIVAAKALLEKNSDPTEEEARFWLAGNLCRCTGYDKIIRAVLDAAAEMNGNGAA